MARARLKRTRWGCETGVGWTRLKNADGRRAYELSKRQPPPGPEAESGAGAEDMALEGGERDEVEDAFVAGFEDDGRSAAGFVGFLPTKGAETPTVAWLEPWEFVLGPRRREVVPRIPAEGEELGGHLGADDVPSHVVGVRAAIAIPEEAGERREAAGLEAFAEYVPGGSG